MPTPNPRSRPNPVILKISLGLRAVLRLFRTNRELATAVWWTNPEPGSRGAGVDPVRVLLERGGRHQLLADRVNCRLLDLWLGVDANCGESGDGGHLLEFGNGFVLRVADDPAAPGERVIPTEPEFGGVALLLRTAG